MGFFTHLRIGVHRRVDKKLEVQLKNQYFGDVNDYKKYGLLRAILSVSNFKLVIAWMLTLDDGSSDGKFTKYLENGKSERRFDPQLFDGLNRLMVSGTRKVELIESTDLIPGATYFSDIVPDSAPARKRWFESLMIRSSGADLIFFDPDNGVEVKSYPFGRKKSSKFVYWSELRSAWETGASLLIYQHFIREKREKFVERMLSSLHEATPGSYVEAFSTANVVFLMALQPRHAELHKAVVSEVHRRWAEQIVHWDFHS